MIRIRHAADRGHADLGWLDSAHTFSFADYHDPAHMGFRALRVLNQDRVAGGHGFPLHPHRDMEIITYVLEGALEHADTMGHKAVLHPGEVQVISAGRGMAHSETNPAPDAPVHFLQMWVLPDRRGGPPGYGQKAFPEGERRGQLRLVASAGGRDGSLPLLQDADVYVTLLGPGEQASLALPPGRQAWVHCARGTLRLDGQRLGPGDGAAVSDEPVLELEGSEGEPADAVVFSLA